MGGILLGTDRSLVECYVAQAPIRWKNQKIRELMRFLPPDSWQETHFSAGIATAKAL